MPSERLAYWGALAGGLAHEIKNPLSTMNISLQLLMEDLKAAPTVPSNRVLPRIELLTGEVERLQRIVNDFLTLAKDPQLDLQPHSVNSIVESLLAFVQPELDENQIELVTQLDGRAPDIRLDSDHFRQALVNIVLNAIQAMPEGGTMTVQTMATETSMTVSVIDTGHGIPKELTKRVFDGFFSTRPGGTGIGLALTQRIIENHGGSISVESSEGQGSRFLISLPMTQEEPEAQ